MMDDTTPTVTSLLDTAGGLLTPRLTTPEPEKGERETGAVRTRLQYLDGLLTPPDSVEVARHHQLRSDDPDLIPVEVDVDIDHLRDWSSKEEQSGPSGARVVVNNTEIAVFKYGDKVIATQAKCPHAGGPLYEGEIEELPDRSLCVRCPWHKWTFCVSGREGRNGRSLTRRKLFGGEERVGGAGHCVSPAVAAARGSQVKVFPASVVRNQTRKTIKIGFENFNRKTLFEEPF